MNHFRKILALVSAAAMLFSCTACSLNMRETYDQTNVSSTSSDKDAPSLTVAEKINDLNSSENSAANQGPAVSAPESPTSETPSEPDEIKQVKIVITGDIKLDEAMIADAKANAADGKEYAFLRMYTGAYRAINDADIAVGAYSAIGKPYGAEAEYEPPTEHLDALASVGYDLLDISGMGSDYRVMEEHGLNGFSDAESGDDAFKSITAEGYTFTFVSVGGENCAQSYNDDKFYEDLEYADLPADCLIVSVHWDEDMESEDVDAIVKRLVSCGADVIVGYGDCLGRTEIVKADDGSSAFVFYSVGDLLSSAEEGYCLCSAIVSLTFTATVSGDEEKYETSASVIPTVVHYTAEKTNYCVYRLEEYTNELARSHGSEVDVEGLTEYVKSKVSSVFLPESLR